MGKVQSTVQPEMKWIIECGINTANKPRKPPFEKKNLREWSVKEGEEPWKEKRG